jgi:hypothetical protein
MQKMKIAYGVMSMTYMYRQPIKKISIKNIDVLELSYPTTIKRYINIYLREYYYNYADVAVRRKLNGIALIMMTIRHMLF